MERNTERKKQLQKSRFPASVFIVYLIVLLLICGIHTGIIVWMNRMAFNGVIQSVLPIIYWSIAAGGLTIFTRKQIRKTYEEPMQNLAEATMKVANGDFSIYVPTIHTADKLDYLDLMILDFNKMVEELGSIETLKTDFVSNVSHEMKTPIAIMKNYAELLQSDNLSADQRKSYAQAIESAAERLSTLISSILKLNKLENQTIVVEAKPYDLSRQLCDCILGFEELLDEKDLQLDVDVEEKAMFFGDPQLMELVWNNLISNAIKFTSKGGAICIRQSGRVVTIADSGCGMDEDCVKHIFDKFYQGDSSRAKEGNGLGMALVKRVLELADADIKVSSQPGVGSEFTITLPERKVYEPIH